MTLPTFNSQISLGNMIHIAVLLAAIAGGWFTLENKVSFAETRVTANQQALRDMQDRVRVLENKDAGDTEQLRTLQRDIAEIKEGQRELQRLIRQLLQRNAISGD